MALAKSILKAISSCNLTGVANNIETWMHALVSHLASVCEKRRLAQALEISVTCSKYYTKYMDHVPPDKASLVPQLLCKIVEAKRSIADSAGIEEEQDEIRVSALGLEVNFVDFCLKASLQMYEMQVLATEKGQEAKMLIGESPTAEMSLLLGHYYFIKYLLQHNADINDKTKQVKLDVGVEGVSMFNSNREMRELVPLSTQEKYLANITKALELWEQGANHWASTQAVSKYLQQHWEVILQCGIRLNLLLQPELAVRTMRVAQGIACQQKLKKGVTETTIHLASSLILQGQYAEPHDILFGRGLDEANKQLLLVRAQYFMYTGQREKAVQSLEGYLKGDQSVGTTATLFDGIARRLLSMCLCFCVNSITAKTNGVNSDGAKTDGVKSDIRSSDGTKLDGVNSDGLKLGKVQGVDGSNTACHLLSLAYEGMHQHLSLVNEAEDEGKTADETEKKVENTSKTPANKNGAQNQGKKDKRTPERIGHCTELSLEIKEKLEKLQPPDCSCLKEVRNSQVQNSKLQTNLESMMTDIEPLSSKKTLFNEPVEVDDVDEAKEDNDTATADKATLQKKVMFDDAAKKVEDEIKSEKKDSASVKADIGKTTAAKVKATPLKQKKVADVLATPKVYSQLVNVFASTKKVKPAASSIAQTPATRIRDLNELIASDDEEDVFFPKKRPITPSVSKSLKAKTEPRNRTIKSEKSTLQGTKANLACKLNFIYQDDDGNESEKQETKDSKRKFFKSKHTIHEEKEHEEDKEITEVSENIQDEFTVKKDVYDIKLELFKDIKTSQQTVKPAKQPSKGRKGVKKSVNKSAQEAVSIIISSPDADPSEVVATDTNSEEKVTTSNTQNENSIKDKSKIEIDVYDIETELSPAVKQNQKSVKSVKGSARAGKRTVKKKETVKETKGLVDSDTSISCETGSNKGSTKKTKVTKKAAAKETISQSEQKKADKENKDTLNVPEAVSEKKKVVKPVKRVTRSARSRKTEEPESVRMLNPGAELGKGNLELRTLDAESDVDHQDAKSNGDSYIDLCIEGEEELLDDICLPNIGNEIGLSPVEIIRSHVHGGGRIDMSLEPGKDIAHECDEIESMRSDVKSGGKAARGTLAKAKKDTVIRKSDRKSKDKVNSNKKVGADNQHDVEDDIGEDSSRESMRSGRLCSTQGMMEKLGFMELLDEGANAEPCVANEGETSAEIFSTLEFLYNQMSCRPPSPQHADLCNLLAYHHFERDTVKAAFYLSDGLAVTFRHQLLLNQTKKMRRVKYNENDGEVKFPPSMSFSAFFNQRSDSVETMISSIPSEWSVVQVSVVSAGLSWKQMVVTRFTRDNKPLVLKLPAFNTKKGSQVVEDFIKIKQSVHMLWGEKDRDKWWKKRFQFDEQLKSLVSCMENLWFDHWRCVLAPREHSTATLELVQSELKAIVGSVVDTSIIEFLLLAAKHLVKGELEKCCLKLIPSVDIVINGTISILKKHKTSTSSVNPHLVLILDKTVQQLPWETLPLLNKMSITRMPCLSYLHSQLSYLQSLESSVYSRGINMRNTSYFLNPGADLKNCETTFEKWFEGEKGWVGVSGKPPTEAQFVEAITSKDMLLYIGHGSGGQYLGYDEIEKLTGQALVVLMGCSSGQLQAKDKDIDKFTEEFLKLCMAAKPGTYIPLLMQKAREVFKMKYINGCAPIMYGLPMFISKN
ncbi:ESPL1-like protein [Mya arenaria]|uniref:separase n=1 Tax=Mya arenaria TaxID=6604 RepID=A0ABY7E3I2_MYAAR|nr:ESPL1-like protein [Mya arenaria]